MRIADVLHDKGSSIITVSVSASLRDAIAVLDRERIGAMPVVNAKKEVVGVLSERDLISVLAEYGDRALRANVGALMSHRVYICSPSDGIAEALSWMVTYRVRHLPVVDDGHLRGLVSIGDLVKGTVEEASSKPSVLPEGICIEL